MAGACGLSILTHVNFRRSEASRRFGPVEYRVVAIPADESKEP